jgi:class 3 adenylate cyclase
MVFFNDPLPTPEPAKRAIEMAAAMREAAQHVLKTWRRHGHDLGFGVGISQGYATLGQIGFAERMDYTAIGTVCNLAARLCSEAKDGQILISRRVAVAVEEDAKLEEIGEVSQGYATLGQIGFAERMDYTAIGTVTNLAARLCGEARGGQVLVSSRVAGTVEALAELEDVGTLTLKGFLKPVPVFNARALRAPAS